MSPLFGPPNVQKLSSRRDVQGLIKAMEYPNDQTVRWAAQEALAHIGQPAVAPLIAALRDSNSTRRSAAAAVLARIGSPALGPLTAALRDSDSRLRQAVAAVLGQMGEEAVKALVPVVWNISDWDEGASAAALQALSQIGDLARLQLISGLTSSDPGERWESAEVLQAMGWEPTRDQAGAAFCIARREWTRCAQLGAVAVRPLIDVLAGPDADAQPAAAAALKQIGAPAVKALLASLLEEDSDVRRKAAWALGRIGNRRAVEPLVAALGDEVPTVRWAVVDALALLGWQPGPDSSGVAYCIAKGHWDQCIEMGEVAVKPLIAELHSADPISRAQAAQALGRIGDRRAVEPLIAALRDGRPDVRRAAAEALRLLRWQPGPDASGVAYCAAIGYWDPLVKLGEAVVELLIGVLQSTDPEYRAGAAQALGRIGDARAVEPLLRLLRDPYAVDTGIFKIVEYLEPWPPWSHSDRRRSAKVIDEYHYPVRLQAAQALLKIATDPAVESQARGTTTTETRVNVRKVEEPGEPKEQQGDPA